nr:hypothetical protein [Marinicella sp. W31]MDC2879999.1 hypothetical protein [Marinicella sp. W31]
MFSLKWISMSYFLNMALVPSILLFLVFGLALFAMTYWVLCLFARFARTDALVIPLGAFIGTIATSWALSLGFVAADIWALHAKADQELTSERSAINRLIGNADAEVLNRPDLEVAMEFYREKVISDEMGRQRKPSSGGFGRAGSSEDTYHHHGYRRGRCACSDHQSDRCHFQ